MRRADRPLGVFRVAWMNCPPILGRVLYDMPKTTPHSREILEMGIEAVTV